MGPNTAPAGETRFAFDFLTSARLPLAVIGVTPATAWVVLADGRFEIRFGFWRLTTTRANVVSARRTGPYRWWRGLGPRLSMVDRGVTFGTSTGPGVCVSFASPVPALAPGGWLRHPAVTVTVADPDALVNALTRGERAGP
ncbi:hypothetical protein GCM10022251_54670 [Phytohabitans flavus]|uniref:Uncharacterized protein n=1 Tax=Phytohabitans flavus TaxID=1076124 RepID=A0A6F8XPX3_9ACTN|nr:hypothetical protein [Phytohabitans flavus]BCB75884.1 hypothetical protein Pflav_022940 [Phytohabitans flavus]